jgi:hypothetical protein
MLSQRREYLIDHGSRLDINHSSAIRRSYRCRSAAEDLLSPKHYS